MHDLANTIVVDLETRSRAEIGCTGSEKYAAHPTTEVVCMSWRRGPQIADSSLPGNRWAPGEPVPSDFFEPDVVFVAAQTTGFELLMFQYVLTPRHGFPYLPADRWECIGAMAAYAGLPQGLDKIGDRLDLGDDAKDDSGHNNMLRLCKPVGATLADGEYVGGEFDNDYVRHAKNRVYCDQDVIAECAAYTRLPRLPDRERSVWLLHHRINRRGIPVDLQLCHGAVSIIKIAETRHLAELEQITRGKINVGKLVNGTVTSVDELARIKSFLADRGVVLPDMQEPTVRAWLPKIDDPDCRRVLEIRMLLTAAAVKKYQATIDWADEDWRCRGFSNYYGAGPGRWSGTLAQFQNLFRPQHKQAVIDAAIPMIQRGDYDAVFALSEGDVFGLLSSCVRSILQSEEGHTFAVSDYSSVEARKLAWLTDEENLLEPFRRGEDLYVKMACEILGCSRDDVVDPATGKPGTPEQKRRRQIGKVPFLGAGYQMGWVHLKEVARDHAGVELTDELARAIVDTFRGNNPKIPKFWRDIENAAKYCAKTGKTISHPKFRFRKHGDWLIMRIPCGRELFYWEPRFEINDEGREQLVYTSPRGTKQLYGGLLTENITQASSRDLLVDSMFRAERRGLNTIMHCHDELVAEHARDGGEAAAMLHECMTQLEPWSEGMPIAAETHDCERYSK